MSRSRISFLLALMVAAVAAPLAHAQSTPSATAPAKSTTAKSSTEAAKAKPAHHSTAPKTMVDLNSASREELIKLPGVGEAKADKIIAARPFKSKSELTEKKILTKEEYKKVSSMVVAHQAK